jgi:hypothetical protein
MKKVFAVVQDEQIRAWCWGTCGKGGLGSINLGSRDAIPCYQAECPHRANDDMGPMGTVGHPDLDGEREVWLRELEPIEKGGS